MVRRFLLLEGEAMDEKDKNIPQPQQPAEQPAQPDQPDQPAPPSGEPVQPPTSEAPATPATPQPAQSEQPAAQPAAQPAQPAQPAAQPEQPTQPYSGTSQPQPAAPPQPGQTPTQPMQPGAAPQPAQPTQPMQPGAAPQPQAGPQPQQPGAGYVPPQPTSIPGAGVGMKPKGTAALVCGIISIPVAWFSPLIAVILAVVAIVLSRRAVKQTGKNGKTTGGLICGIVGIVCAIVSFIIAMVLSISLIGGSLSGTTQSSYSGSTSTEPTSDLTADEQACYDLGIAKLEQLKNQDGEIVTYLATELDQGFEESMGVTHEDLGTNSEDLARWMLTDFNYSYDGVYVDEEEGTATMYADLEMRDSFLFMNNFYDLANDFVNSGEAESMTADEAAQRLGEYYKQAMDETTDMTSYYTAIDFVKNADGTWSVDEDAWNDELGFMFGIY